jgi:hypothetical protein
MRELHQKKMNLEALVIDFQNNSEDYIKIIKAVEEKVLGVLSNVKALLRCALLSITESARNNPERYRLIFYNMPSSMTDCYDTNGQDYPSSYMYGGQIQQQSQQYPSPNYNTEDNIAVIVDEAEKLYSKVVKDCINKVNVIDHHLSKASSLPLLPSPNEEELSHSSSTSTTANQI